MTQAGGRPSGGGAGSRNGRALHPGGRKPPGRNLAAGRHLVENRQVDPQNLQAGIPDQNRPGDPAGGRQAAAFQKRRTAVFHLFQNLHGTQVQVPENILAGKAGGGRQVFQRQAGAVSSRHPGAYVTADPPRRSRQVVAPRRQWQNGRTGGRHPGRQAAPSQ